MDRIARATLFHAEVVDIPWSTIVGNRAQRLHAEWEGISRADDVRLTWSCSADLGVPHSPFLVSRRQPGTENPTPIDCTVLPDDGGLGITWNGVEAGRVVVECQVSDAAKPVILLLHRLGEKGLRGLVGATVGHPGGAPSVVLDIRTSGATTATLVNGFDPFVSIVPLQEVVSADDWEPFELVGLPAPQPWDGTDYVPDPQGMVWSPTSPFEAAVARVVRGGPPIGWEPAATGGIPAPPWIAPDPYAVVSGVSDILLKRLQPLYAPGAAEHTQRDISLLEPVDPPLGSHSLSARADVKPWATLAVTAHVDPFYNLASGFGTAYSIEARGDGQGVGVGAEAEFLVTAPFTATGSGGPAAELAAYAPRGLVLVDPPTVTDLSVARSGIITPENVNAPWRESIVLSFHRERGTANLGTQTQQAGFVQPQGGTSEPIMEQDEQTGAWKTLAISPDAPEGKPGWDRASFSHGGVPIPLGSGGRKVTYAIATGDVYGVWTPWSRIPYSGDEPLAQAPRIVSVRAEPRFEGANSCPARLTCDLVSERDERAAAAIHVRVYCVPRPDPRKAAATFAPEVGVPGGGLSEDFTITFNGDVPSAVGATVTEMTPDGARPLVAGDTRDDRGRRYRLIAEWPTIDFGVSARWDATAWASRDVTAGPSPSPWSAAAWSGIHSPVPPPAPLPSAPPGVPLASMPDASGVSHARVDWTPPGGEVRRAIVWECAETSLRQRSGREPRAAEQDTPGQRLQALWGAYDELSPAHRRQAFRRIAELPQENGVASIPLPKGSTDIHLFLVTFVTSTGIESPWPGAPGDAHKGHEYLQQAIAPRVVQPAAPRVKARSTAAGTVLVFESDSDIAVDHFLLLRTVKPTAALRAESMGPATAIPATAGPDPDRPGKTATDPVSGRSLYEASWSGDLGARWEPWLIRAIAVPEVPPPHLGLRGRNSSPSDLLAVSVLPDDAPSLESLVADDLDGEMTTFAIRTATTAPRTTSIGEHVLHATVDGTPLASRSLSELVETDGSTAPVSMPSWEQQPRSARRSPLTLWVRKADVAADAEVVVSLTDPRGRTTLQTLTIPGWTPPAATLTLQDSYRIAGRGGVILVTTHASSTAGSGYRLDISASRNPFPIRRDPPPILIPGQEDPLTLSVRLEDVGGAAAPGRIGVALARAERPDDPDTYSIFVPIARRVFVWVTLVGPDGKVSAINATV